MPFDDDCLFLFPLKEPVSSYFIFLVSSCSIVVVVFFMRSKLRSQSSLQGLRRKAHFGILMSIHTSGMCIVSKLSRSGFRIIEICFQNMTNAS